MNFFVASFVVDLSDVAMHSFCLLISMNLFVAVGSQVYASNLICKIWQGLGIKIFGRV